MARGGEEILRLRKLSSQVGKYMACFGNIIQIWLVRIQKCTRQSKLTGVRLSRA